MRYANRPDQDKDGVKYAHPERTCKECSLYPCFKGMENFVCDFAKYGCKQYKNHDSDHKS